MLPESSGHKNHGSPDTTHRWEAKAREIISSAFQELDLSPRPGFLILTPGQRVPLPQDKQDYTVTATDSRKVNRR